jgi:hypothetical protein
MEVVLMKRTLQILAIAFYMGMWWLPALKGGSKPLISYDGNWWFLADRDERLAFVYGCTDCLAYTAKVKWLSDSTMEGNMARITNYYQNHPADKATPIVEIWRSAQSEGSPEPPHPKGGEAYTNPHGIFDGWYWLGGSELQRKGFVEGYLSCFRRHVQSPSETYSQPINYYVEKINSYFEKNPRSGDESIANILSKFCDKPPATNKQPKKNEPVGRGSQ